MTNIEITILLIKGLISELQAEQQSACLQAVKAIRLAMDAAGEPSGTIAIALVGAQCQQAAELAEAERRQRHSVNTEHGLIQIHHICHN